MMTPETKPSHVRRKAAALAQQNAGKDAVAVRLKSAVLQPIKTPTDSSSAAHKEWRHPTPMSRTKTTFYGAAKRAFDFIVGLALLVVTAPIILIAAIAIRL